MNVASTNVKEQLYKSLVRPSVEYASTVWDPYEKRDVNRLEIVQRRGARYVKNRYHNRSSVTDMLADLRWPSLQERRCEARLAMYYNIVNGQVGINMNNRLSQNDTKTDPESGVYRYHLPFCRTLYRQQSFFPRTTGEWNKLPSEVILRGHTVDSFRARLANLRE